MQSTDISKSHASLIGWGTKPHVPAMHLTTSAGLGIQNSCALKVEGTNGQNLGQQMHSGETLA